MKNLPSQGFGSNELNLEKLSSIEGIEELTLMEYQSINGGSESMWDEVASVVGSIFKGIVTFSTEGGRNAGLTAH